MSDTPIAQACMTCGRDPVKDWLLCREHFVADLAAMTEERDCYERAYIKAERRQQANAAIAEAWMNAAEAFKGLAAVLDDFPCDDKSCSNYALMHTPSKAPSKASEDARESYEKARSLEATGDTE